VGSGVVPSRFKNARACSPSATRCTVTLRRARVDERFTRFQSAVGSQVVIAIIATPKTSGGTSAQCERGARSMPGDSYFAELLVGGHIASVLVDSEVTYIMLTNGTQITIKGLVAVQPKPRQSALSASA